MDITRFIIALSITSQAFQDDDWGGYYLDIKCSVIIPVYNCDRFIAETVESVQRQTIQELEIIIIDDCSTDNSLEIIKKIAEHDERIKIFQNEINSGVAQTRNKGIELSSGAYITLLDGDDVWLPDKLEKQLNYLASKGGSISYCSYGFIDNEGHDLGTDFIVPSSITLTKLLSNSVISCSTVIAERELFLRHKFNKDYYHEDFVLWIDILKECEIAFGHTDVLAKIRIRKGSRSGNKLNSAKQRWLVYKNYLHLNMASSAYFYSIYIFLTIHKYWRLRKAL